MVDCAFCNIPKERKKDEVAKKSNNLRSKLEAHKLNTLNRAHKFILLEYLFAALASRVFILISFASVLRYDAGFRYSLLRIKYCTRLRVRGCVRCWLRVTLDRPARLPVPTTSNEHTIQPVILTSAWPTHVLRTSFYPQPANYQAADLHAIDGFAICDLNLLVSVSVFCWFLTVSLGGTSLFLLLLLFACLVFVRRLLLRIDRLFRSVQSKETNTQFLLRTRRVHLFHRRVCVLAAHPRSSIHM